MSDAVVAPRDESLKPVLLIAYGLYALGVFNGITIVAGVVLAYLKRGEAQGTVWQSHCRNLIHLFWMLVIIGAVGGALLLWGAGGFLWMMNQTDGQPGAGTVAALVLILPAIYLACIAIVIYYAYRVLRGAIRALESKPY